MTVDGKTLVNQYIFKFGDFQLGANSINDVGVLSNRISIINVVTQSNDLRNECLTRDGF